MGKQYKGAIFDLDGVLVDTTGLHFQAWKKLANELGISFSEVDNQKLKGVSRMTSLELLLTSAGRKYSDQEKKTLAEKKDAWYRAELEKLDESAVLPGVLPLLQRLRKAGYKIAVGSASRNAHLSLDRTGLSTLFDVVVDGTMVGSAKPDPELFMTAASLLELPAQSCVVYEDSLAGVQAAQNAGMACIGVGETALPATLCHVRSLCDSRAWEGIYEAFPVRAALDHALYIFDMGNVVVKNITVLKQISAYWKLPWQEFYDDYCRYDFPLMDGMVDTQDYWRHIEHKFHVAVSGEPFSEWFKPVPNAPVISVLHYLRTQGKRIVCGSNTFAPHWEVLEKLGFTQLFDASYPSHLIGLSKPSAAYFSYILEMEKTRPEDTYFVDDLQENIDAARALGIRSLHYASTELPADMVLRSAFGSTATGGA